MNRQTDLVRTKILSILADGEFHSGEELGHNVGVSRAAISKHIQWLSSLGLDVFRVTGKGYKLANPIQFLNPTSILQDVVLPEMAELEVLNIIDSTNQYLKDKIADLHNGHACLAEAQTAGRGRHGRKWVSPYGSSLYLSYYWRFEAGYQAISGLSLAVGVAITDALDELGIVGVQLKWPNDLYCQHKKLAGVLVEVEGQMGAACDCIIGVGLNIDLAEQQNEIDQPWIDLSSIANRAVDRNRVAAKIIDSLISAMKRFEKDGLESFLSKWQALDLYREKPIRLIVGNKTLQGIGKGISHDGGLLVEVEGNIQTYYGGEISVRAG